MKTRRTWHPTKAAWARSQADRLHAMARETAVLRVPSGNWRAVQGKMRRLDTLRREAARFELLAKRLGRTAHFS